MVKVICLITACSIFLSITGSIAIAQAEVKIAVTISVEAGPALTEGKLEKVALIVPERPAKAMPLKVGDKVFFEALDPLLEGEGIILNIYEMNDKSQGEPLQDEAIIKEAIILDHVVR